MKQKKIKIELTEEEFKELVASFETEYSFAMTFKENDRLKIMNRIIRKFRKSYKESGLKV